MCTTFVYLIFREYRDGHDSPSTAGLDRIRDRSRPNHRSFVLGRPDAVVLTELPTRKPRQTREDGQCRLPICRAHGISCKRSIALNARSALGVARRGNRTNPCGHVCITTGPGRFRVGDNQQTSNHQPITWMIFVPAIANRSALTNQQQSRMTS